MAIDYTVDIVETLFASNVVTESEYQIPGDFGLANGFGTISLSGGTIDTPGTGYSVDDVLTISGGTSTTTARVKVTDVSTGAVTAIEVNRAGVYTVIPTGHLSVTGGGGSGFKLDATWDGFGQQRILTFVEMMRSYLEQIESTHEAKLLQEVMGRMMATMKLGHSWNANNVSVNAQSDSMHFISGHVRAADL